MKRLLLPPRIDAAGALSSLRRRRLLNLYGLLRQEPARKAPDGTPLSIELIWMPAYTFRAVMIHAGRQRFTQLFVDGSFGAFALFGRLVELREEDAAGEVFPPVLDTAAAEAIAREELVRYIMRKRGAKPEIQGLDSLQFFSMPFWVYYFKRRGGKLDFAVVDAYTGQVAGGRMRQAVINGLIQKRKNDGQGPPD